MFYRFFNKGGKWHKPASLNPKDWEKFTFDINWENLNKMYNLRKYYLEISPPFSKDDAGKVIEMEKMQDDILYYHIKRSWFALLLWIIFTQVFVDPEKMDLPARHALVNNYGFSDEEIMPADTNY